MFSWPSPYSAHSSRFLFLTAFPWPSSPLSSVHTPLWAVSHETSQRLSSVSPELYTSLLFCLLTSKRLFMANPYFPERPSAHTWILLKACPMGHPPSATFFSLWLVLHCFLLVHDLHTLLRLSSHLEVGERMRNRNIRERSLIMRIGAYLYWDQEVLLSSQDKLETQESGWVLQLRLTLKAWEPRKSLCGKSSSKSENQELQHPWAGKGGCSSWTEFTLCVHICSIHALRELGAAHPADERVSNSNFDHLKEKNTLKIQPEILDYLGISTQTGQHIELTITDPHYGLLQQMLLPAAGF